MFIMQIGFSMLEVGSVNIKNTKNILTKNLIDASIITLVWWCFGHSFAFGAGSGSTEFVGSGDYFPSQSLPDISFGLSKFHNTANNVTSPAPTPILGTSIASNEPVLAPSLTNTNAPKVTEIMMNYGNIYEGSAFWLYQWVGTEIS